MSVTELPGLDLIEEIFLSEGVEDAFSVQCEFPELELWPCGHLHPAEGTRCPHEAKWILLLVNCGLEGESCGLGKMCSHYLCENDKDRVATGNVKFVVRGVNHRTIVVSIDRVKTK